MYRISSSLTSSIWILLISGFIVGCSSCPCGKRRLGKTNGEKIIGGSLSQQNAWPWTVALVYMDNGKTNQYCGGSLIDNKYVLSAAHCLQEIRNRPLSDLQVFMGDTKINGTNIVKYGVDSIKIHPSYDPKVLSNDIGLIKLSRIVTFTDSIRPICLHNSQSQPLTAKTTAIVVGWGAVRNGGSNVNSQRQVQIQIVPTDNCRRNYSKVGIKVTPNNMICAASNKKDSCSGDSGGPLFIKRKKENIFEQIGIVSFGRHCAQPSFPGVYTKISAFIKFIQANTKDARKC